MSKRKPEIGDTVWIKKHPWSREWECRRIIGEWAANWIISPYGEQIPKSIPQAQNLQYAFSLEQKNAIDWMYYIPKRIKARLHRERSLTRSQWERIAQIIGYNPEIQDIQQ